jgi:hypothetical protein
LRVNGFAKIVIHSGGNALLAFASRGVGGEGDDGYFCYFADQSADGARGIKTID